jgi:alpha-ribazole phosphatase
VSLRRRRVRDFDPGPARIVVAHGGWLSAATWLARGANAAPCSERWSGPPKHGERVASGLCSGSAG